MVVTFIASICPPVVAGESVMNSPAASTAPASASLAIELDSFFCLAQCCPRLSTGMPSAILCGHGGDF